MKIQRIKISLLSITLIFSVFSNSIKVFGEQQVGTSSTANTSKIYSEDTSKESKVLTMEEAISQALKNSTLIKQVDNKEKLSIIKRDSSIDIGNDLEDGQESVDDGYSEVNDSDDQITQAQEQIDAARTAVNNGIAPINIPITGTSYIIPAGTNISSFLSANNLPASLKDTIVVKVNDELDEKQETLDDNKDSLSEGKLKLYVGEMDLNSAKRVIASSLSEKLDITELNELSSDQFSELLQKMTYSAYIVTTAAKDIYRNQVIMLVQKSYYDALNAQNMLKVKEDAMVRGKTQYEFAKDGYENGMKSKDDMLLANIYYTSTKLEFDKAKASYENSLIELKKNTETPLDTDIVIKGVAVDEQAVDNLKYGLKKGLKDRLEIIKAEAQLEVYELDLELVESAYGEDSNRYKEAKLLKENAKLELDKAKMEVESSIRQSHKTYIATVEMLRDSKEMVDQAKECLDIAQYKYNEGFSGDSSLMTKLDLQSSTGTMLEVIAAQENLSQVEEKYAEIQYGYNLSKVKYYNDICKFQY